MIKLIKSTFYHESETKKKLAGFIRKSPFLSFGRECQKFEKNFAKWQGRKYGVMVNSGSSANLALIQSLLNLGWIKKNDPAGFSSVTWSTNAMPLIQLGLKAIPVDVELDSLNMSSKTLSNILSKFPLRVLFLTNLLGLCADLEKIVKICRDKKIILLEDNCEALGSIYVGKKLGNFGLASTFSFYVGHHFSTIEGGAICTDNPKLAGMLKIVRAHGWDRNLDFAEKKDLRKKFKVNSIFYSRYTFYDLGFNLRPTEIAGFLGNEQLQYIDEIIKKRGDNFRQFSRLYDNENYYPLRFKHLDVFSNFSVPLICKSREIRDMLVKICNGKVEVRPVVGGDITSQPFFRKYQGDLGINCPNAKIIHDQGLYFGNNPEMTKEEMAIVLKLFDF